MLWRNVKNYSRRYLFVILFSLVVPFFSYGAGTKVEKRFGLYKISLSQNFDNGLAELIIKKGQSLVYEERGIGNHYSFGNSFDETAKQVGFYKNITGNGIPNLIISNWTGGAHCCHILHIFELGKEFKKLVTVQANSSSVRLVDLDRDGNQEIEFWDGAIDYQFASFADSPGGRVVLKYRDNHYEVAVDLMAKTAPSSKEIDLVKKTVSEAFKNEKTPNLPFEFLNVMMDLSYSGNSKMALLLAEELWPSDRPGLEKFKAEFSQALRESLYWKEF